MDYINVHPKADE